MAHEITSTDSFGEVRSGGKKAWHGLGIEIPDGLGAWEGFQKIGLAWDTALVPVTVDVQGHLVTDPETQLHVRLDTHTSLGIVGKDYKKVGNQVLADFADSLCGADKAVILETAGSLRGGRKVFCTLRLPRDIEVIEGDILNMYVVGSNAHDGTGAFQWYSSSIRVVCANTLAMSEHSARGMIKFQHTGNVAAKVELAQQSLGIVSKQVDKYEKEVRSLVKKGLKKAAILDYMAAVYDQTFGKISDEWPAKQQASRLEHKTRTVVLWTAKMDEPHQQIKGIAGTAWAAYNGFSEWSDHERGHFLSTQESESRIHSNLFGISSRDKQRAYRQALALVK